MNRNPGNQRRCVLSCCVAATFAVAIGFMSELFANTNAPSGISVNRSSLLFEENRGQFASSFDYVARGRGYNVGLAVSPQIELVRYKAEISAPYADLESGTRAPREIEALSRFRMRILGADESARPTALEKNVARTNYLIGQPSQWKTNISNYQRIRYAGILDNIDVEYYGREGRLEYDFVVHPGGDPAAIRLDFPGAGGVSIDAKGELLINLGEAKIAQRRPVCFQISESGESDSIECDYVLFDGVVGFRAEQWDSRRPLIIDPVLEYSRYYGGNGTDISAAVDIDAAGNIYVVGMSDSAGLATAGAYSESGGARLETFSYLYCPDCPDADEGLQVERVAISGAYGLLFSKFSPDGQTLLWSTYLNSVPAQDLTIGLNSAAVSDSGEVAVGLTVAPEGLPLVSETQSFDSGQTNVYVAKLNSDGDGLVFATYLNIGDFGLWLRGLDVSADGKVAVSGALGGANSFPVVTGIPGQSCTMNDTEWELTDGYVSLFSTAGALLFSSCLGGDIADGSSTEGLRGIAIGDDGDLYVVGYSSMTDFPVVNPIQATKNVSGAREMTISQIDPDTGALVFSTWLGPAAEGYSPAGYDYEDYGHDGLFFPGDIVYQGGSIVVTGTLTSLSYPTLKATQANQSVPREPAEFYYPSIGIFFGARNEDCFLTKLRPDQGLAWSTYLGGSSSEGGIPALATDTEGNIYLAAVSRSENYPTVNAIQPSRPAPVSLVLSKFTPQGALAFSSYFGGTGSLVNYPGGIAVNSSGKIILASYANSDDFPIVGSGTSHNGGYDMTLAIIDQSGDTDTDGDGVPDAVDAFPDDDTEWRDIDGDLTGDNSDTDDDGDGEPDVSDRFPQDPLETADADEDGAGDNLDEFDADLANYFDLDDDGIADFDAAELDIDGDGTLNADDAFDLDATEVADADGDGLGDNADPDDDGDLTPDATDPAPLDFDVPIRSFERYSAYDTNLFKSSWPAGFAAVGGADTAWTSATDQAYSGRTSFGSRIIEDGQAAAIQFSSDFEAGFVQFRYKVDSQASADLLTFKVDGGIVLTDSGDTGWKLFSALISAGAHTLEWRYAKDGAGSAGADAAWIDDLKIAGEQVFLEGFE